MENQDLQAILVICLSAAFADGNTDDREREEMRRIAQNLAPEGEANFAALYQDVLLKRRTAAQAAQTISSNALKQLAYEMAVCVCDVDGTANEQEKAFLTELRGHLGIDPGVAAKVDESAAQVASLPVAVPQEPTVNTGVAELDSAILRAAILNGALELLPQSLASMAIIPLQMKLVHRIGKHYGYEADKNSIKDFLMTAGVGLTSQYVEQIGRKLLGGLLKKAGGGLLGSLGGVAAGAAFSFATTYAIGHVAKQYYADGRKLDATKLKAAFAKMLEEGKQLGSKYAGEIQQKASGLDTTRITELVRNA